MKLITTPTCMACMHANTRDFKVKKKKKETELNAERSRIETLKRFTSIKWVFAKRKKKKGRNKKRVK